MHTSPLVSCVHQRMTGLEIGQGCSFVQVAPPFDDDRTVHRQRQSVHIEHDNKNNPRYHRTGGNQLFGSWAPISHKRLILNSVVL